MKLANHLSIRLTGLFVILFFIWSVVYFVMQMYEIYEGVDEGLTNLKQELILKADKDARFIENMERYNPINMNVSEISGDEARIIEEEFATTEVYFETEQEFLEVRMLTSAFMCQANHKFYRIQLFTTTIETENLIQNMLTLLIGLWLTLVLLILVASRFIIRRSSEPFNELLDKLRGFNLDRTQMIDFPKTNITEFKALNNAVESLLEENIKTYQEQKIFIENASHELQTPLAVVISKIELLMESETIPEQQLKDLSVILSSLSRMKRLNNSLLLLSKINNRQFPDNLEIDFEHVVHEVLENFIDLIKHKNITLDIDIREVPVVKMNEDLAHIMISNLVKNAVNYNLPEGRITITLDKGYLSICNDGKPLPDGVDIFERYKSGQEVSTSTGLGLAIVSSIVSNYNFKIKHSYNGMHCITINFHV